MADQDVTMTSAPPAMPPKDVKVKQEKVDEPEQTGGEATIKVEGGAKVKEEKAKTCMALLVSAAPDASEDLESDDELVKRLATMVYYAGDTGFCDCATDEKAIPHCADFDDFRAVVREAHEACDALDRVDCAYLGAYADACRAALVNEFGSLDLTRKDQCAYVDEVGCGGLPIPAVRRWDCLLDDNYELTSSQRDLVNAVIDDCAEATDDDPAPAPALTNDDSVEAAGGDPSQTQRGAAQNPNAARNGGAQAIEAPKARPR